MKKEKQHGLKATIKKNAFYVAGITIIVLGLLIGAPSAPSYTGLHGSPDPNGDECNRLNSEVHEFDETIKQALQTISDLKLKLWEAERKDDMVTWHATNRLIALMNDIIRWNGYYIEQNERKAAEIGSSWNPFDLITGNTSCVLWRPESNNRDCSDATQCAPLE